MTGDGQLQLITEAQQNADILNNMSSSHQVHELSSPFCNSTKNNNQHQECRKTVILSDYMQLISNIRCVLLMHLTTQVQITDSFTQRKSSEHRLSK